MSFALFLVFALLAVFGVRWLLFWSLPEPQEDTVVVEPPANPAVFYNPRSWATFQPRPLISYRRDKRGRFRKMP